VVQAAFRISPAPDISDHDFNNKILERVNHLAQIAVVELFKKLRLFRPLLPPLFDRIARSDLRPNCDQLPIRRTADQRFIFIYQLERSQVSRLSRARMLRLLTVIDWIRSSTKPFPRKSIVNPVLTKTKTKTGVFRDHPDLQKS